MPVWATSIHSRIFTTQINKKTGTIRMALIKGIDCSFYVYDNGGFRLVACGREWSLTTTASGIETSTTGSGADATYEYEKRGWTANVAGVCNLDKPGQLAWADMRAFQQAFRKILVNFERIDIQGNAYVDSGTVLITSVGDVENINDVATFSIDLLGDGRLTQIYTPTNLPLSAVRRYQAVATGGETTINIPSLINKDILSVVRDGIGNSAIITSGTPVDKQVKYTAGTGDFEWMVPFEPNEAYYILYQDI